jgi:bifunctional polynucleotide phosphatase/kinase
MVHYLGPPASETKSEINKIIMFDLDSTIVTTKSGNIMPKNADDWKWLYPEVLPKINELSTQGYTIIIITNQSGINKSNHRMERIKNIKAKLPKEVEIYIADEKDLYRKPNTKIFEEFILPRLCDITKIPFIGDAAGRSKDHSADDRKFAYNIYLLMRYEKPDIKDLKVYFWTPEEYFLKKKDTSKREWEGFNPDEYLKNQKPIELPKLPTEQFAVILIGPPGSGKSTLASKLQSISGAVIINKDTLNTKAKCHKAVKDAIHEGQCVIIDETSPNEEVRQEYTDCIGKKVKTIFIIMDVPIEMAEHMNQYRERIGDKRVPSIVYKVYNKKYEPPGPPESKNVIHYRPYLEFKNNKEKMYFLQKS